MDHLVHNKLCCLLCRSLLCFRCRLSGTHYFLHGIKIRVCVILYSKVRVIFTGIFCVFLSIPLPLSSFEVLIYIDLRSIISSPSNSISKFQTCIHQQCLFTKYQYIINWFDFYILETKLFLITTNAKYLFHYILYIKFTNFLKKIFVY